MNSQFNKYKHHLFIISQNSPFIFLMNVPGLMHFFLLNIMFSLEIDHIVEV